MLDALSSFLKAFLTFLQSVGLDRPGVLVLFIIFLPLFFFAYWLVKRGMVIALRPIAGYAALKGMLGQAAEAGQPVHLSLGVTGIGDQFTADTMAGLTVLEFLAERGAISATPPIVTLANPTALPVAQDLMRRAFNRQGYPEEYNPTSARFIAPDPSLNTSTQNDAFAYAAGTMQLLNDRKLTANVLVGRFGDEFMLLGETGAQRNLTQIGGTSAERVLPLFQATMTHPLIGEEIYAAGAYLSDKPAHLSSLLAQDVSRWLIVGGVIVLIVLKTMGLI